ncbi:lamin tail domain-containing protein [Thermococcus sp. M36]|uniref:lamin tail domain-containing protein n=1 Tax=Thermococcus sp. M36 TaxID=1638261 RepID=UPI00143AE8A8|nr:lamin tail domain-containing protein [Thermococcus sp. M36]NJE05892.1 lamin tail domain-containing protein [Thermococcus sp. M36]
MPNATEEEKEALLTLIEAMLNGTLNGEITVSDTMKIKNAQWNGTDLIFEIWWYDGINPVAIKTYRWRNPRQALQLVHQMKNGKASEESLEEAFTVEPLTISYAVHIEDVDYLTNDGSGEYVFLHNPGLSTVSLLGWYIMDEYAYNNPSCWINNTIPRDDCIDSYGKDHVVRFSINIPPGAVVRIPVASSPYNAILNNDGDTVYLIDDKGYFAGMYSYSASPEITVEGISYYPNPLREGNYMDLTIVLDNRGALDGTGTIEVYIDGKLVKSSTETVWKYHIWYYKMYDVWKATSGTHVLTVKFVPQYGGEVSSKSITFTVSASKPYIAEVTHNDLVEGYPAEFHVDVVNPAGERKDIILKLFVDGVEVDTVTSYVYEKWGFDLQWSNPEKEFHKVEIKLYDESGTVLYSQWASTLYFRPNTPPRIESVQLPSWVYANEWSNGTIQVYDSEGDLVDVKVNVIGRFSFTRSDLSSGVPYEFPLAPIYNHTNCRENVTVEFTPTDQYGMTGETITKVLTVVTDSDKDGWCNGLELEYGTNPYSKDTDGDGVIDPKDFDPLRDAVIELYLFRARALDPAEDDDQDWNVDFRIEATFKAGSITQTLKEDLPDNTQDVENMVMLTNDLFENIQKEAVAVLKFNPPDNVETVEIDLKLVDRDSGFIIDNPDEIMDISPRPGDNEDGKVARLFFSLKNGTWWGDDYINDHKDYFGYGHLSGADDSTEDYTNGGEYDAEPFSKYYDELEALGYDLSVVNITDVKGWDGIESLELKDYQSGALYQYTNPEEAVLFTLSLPDGTQKRVLIINKRNAEVKTMKLNDEVSATSTEGVDKDANVSNLTINATAGIGKKARYEATLIFRNETGDVKTLSTESVSSSETSTETSSLTFDVVATSEDIDEDDAEIWFLIKLNDDDGIPFYRELELNKELEKQGITERFDPTDGFWAEDPAIYEGLIEKDAYGDYDGDGVPNAVELFIGKNPTKPDVLGIKLTVAVGWNASQTYLTQLVKGFQRASQVIYDYTDGYAMITEISIKNNVQVGSEEWENSMVRIYPGTNGSVTAPIGWYWGWINRDPNRFSEYVKLFETFNGQYPDGKLYYRPIAHELGHFVFAVADEYYTKRIFYIPKGKLEVIGYDNITAELSKRGITFRVLPTIMESSYEFTEFSTPDEYEWFNAQLYSLQNTLVNIYRAYGWYVDSWEDFTTSQWGDLVYSINGDKSVSPMSAWKTVFALLSRNQTLVIESSNGWAAYVGHPMNAGLILDLDFDNKEDSDFPRNYMPKTGPYTGVGYYLMVEVS